MTRGADGVVALAGGVGAARFLQGLVRVIDPSSLTVIVNTGDDVELYGLYISPDPDIVVYTLAGVVDEVKGWGFAGDTFNFMRMLERYGFKPWFKLGDMDLATHVLRTWLLRRGFSLSYAIDFIRRRLGVSARILPMSDDRVRTKLVTDVGMLEFQEYFVKYRTEPEVKGVVFEGIETAKPAPGVLESIQEASGIIVCPSNPIVSIAPILSVKGVRDAIRRSRAVKVAISPIVGGKTIKGPADRMMRSLGYEPTAYGVASLYRDFLDYFILDKVDSHMAARIERELGVKVLAEDTVMKTMSDKVRLAKAVMEVIRGGR
ncbi:MAG: 2-phospho-L-lactate transferase [Thermoproteota archaeon]|nr:MAG: 2-phospho-L-lactate transferase [Candidatus Korarchaeota archaeon]